MKYVKDDDCFVIEKWMIKDLGLASRELLLYAIIYTETNKKGEFCGSLNYMAEWLGTNSTHTVLRAINALINKGLVTKKQTTKDGVITNHYKAVLSKERS